MKKEPKYQNLFNHPHILYKYFPLNNDYARRYKDDPKLLTFTPSIDKSVIWEDWENVDKWETIVFDGAIYCTSPAFFNDPFDTALPLMPDKVPTENERKEIISQLSVAFHFTFKETKELLDAPDFENAILRKFHEIGLPDYLCQKFSSDLKKNTIIYKELMAISCFSENNKSKLMWGHYANSYSGVCIEYDFTKIKDEQFRRGINKVIYSNKRPKREDYDNDYDYTIAVLATKSEEWSYEKEWRLNYVLPYGQAIDKYYPVYYAKEAITSIYLGCNIDKVKKEKIVECYSDRGLPVFEMRLSDNEFDFSFVKVN